MGQGIKNTHPLKDQGWDTKYSTVPPWLRPKPSLIVAFCESSFLISGDGDLGLGKAMGKTGYLVYRGFFIVHHQGKRAAPIAKGEFLQMPIRSNGRTRHGISAIRLRSGIVRGRGAEALQQNGFLSGQLTSDACLRHSFYAPNLAHFPQIVNPAGKYQHILLVMRAGHSLLCGNCVFRRKIL